MNLDSAVFYSNDIEKVIPFYRDILGFKVDYQQGETFVAFIFPNGARLSIKKKRDEREIPGYQTVFISVDDIEKLYNELKQKNIEFYTDLATFDWGTEFSILDADRNKVLFIKR